jgi:hypothetical protein
LLFSHEGRRGDGTSLPTNVQLNNSVPAAAQFNCTLALMGNDDKDDNDTITIPQIWKAFFYQEGVDEHGTPSFTVPPSPSDIARWLNPDNPDYLLTQFLGNAKVINELTRAARAALARPDHRCNDHNYVLLGPSSHKAVLARCFAQLLKLPFVEISPKTIRSLNDIVVRTAESLEQYDLGGGHMSELAGVSEDGILWACAPPLIMFVDGVNFLQDDVVQGLAKAIDKAEAIVDTGPTVMGCEYVCWMVGATRIGELPAGFVDGAVRLKV